MSVLRFVATLCLLIAVIALVSDLTPTAAGQSGTSLTSVEAHWRQVSPATFKSSEAAFTGSSWAWVWTNLIGSVLAVPTFILFALLAVLLGYLGRRKSRVKVYAN